MESAHPFLVRKEHVEALESIRALLERILAFALEVNGRGQEKGEIETLISHLDEVFLVVVVGEVKSGKSSLVNTLLRSDVCAVGPTPVTDRINILRFGETEEMREDEPFVVDRFVPSERLKGLAIVDTPGTNSIVKRHDEITRSFLPRADLVLFVTSCDRPYSESENLFLHLISERWRRKIVFVLSKTDIREPEEVTEIREYVARCCSEELGFDPEIIPVAVKVADRALAAGDAADLDASGLPALEEFVLTRLDEAEKSRLRLFGLTDAAGSVLERLSTVLGEASRVLDEDYRALGDLEERTLLKRSELLGMVRGIGDGFSTLFTDLRDRGDAFIARRFRLLRALGSMRRGRTARQFREQVVGDFDERLVASLDAAVDRLGAETTAFLEDTLSFFRYRVDGEARGAPEGRPPTGFAARREEVIRRVRRHAEEHVETFDLKRQARAVLEAGRKGLGVSAAGVGAGVLTAAVAGLVVNLWWSVVAIPVVVAGLAAMGVMRGRAVREWHDRVRELEDRFQRTLAAELSREIDHAVDEAREIYRPCREFYESEAERMSENALRLDGIAADLTKTRGQIEKTL
jgi:GTP-binding protein EngB required for normal cell division